MTTSMITRQYSVLRKVAGQRLTHRKYRVEAPGSQPTARRARRRAVKDPDEGAMAKAAAGCRVVAMPFWRVRRTDGTMDESTSELEA
jgi:hypothetical protein